MVQHSAFHQQWNYLSKYGRAACVGGTFLVLALSGCARLRPSEPDPLAALRPTFEIVTDTVVWADLTLPDLEEPETAVFLAPLPEAELPPDTVMLPPDDRAAFLAELRIEPIGSGTASFYGRRFAGRRTASGERFDPSALTAAHRTLPFGSHVRVTHLRTGRTIVVRINDRGPFHGRRIIDLSRAAAEAIGMVRSGTAPVKLELLPTD